MPYSWRSFRPALLVVLLLALAFPLVSPATYAQDTPLTPIVIQGSQQLEALVQAVRDAYVASTPDADIQIAPEGPNRGFDALCSGEADMVMSTAPISDQQIEACNKNGVDFIETVLAYEAVVLLPTPEAELACIGQEQINGAWSLGAPGEVRWAELGSPVLTTPVKFYGPEDFTAAYTLFKELVPAGDLREDIVTTSDVAQIVTKVNEQGSNAFGFMSLADWERVDPDVTVIPAAVQDVQGNCTPPALSTLEAHTYPLARSAYLYVSAPSAQRPEVQAFVRYALTDPTGAPAQAAGQGYSVPTPAAYELGLNNVLNGNVGRTFSRPVTPVEVSTAETGTVTIAGTSIVTNLTNRIKAEFGARFVNAEVTVETLGNTGGWASFCKGEADVLQTTRPATEDELKQCADNGIETYTIDLGREALIFAVPPALDKVECLTAAEVSKMLAAGTEDAPAPAKWNEINADWPDLDLMLVLPSMSTGETDYLAATLLKQLNFVVRLDVIEKDDPLYRAQGVVNAGNGLTYLWWSAFQGSQSGAKLLSLDAGNGCSAPSPETFADGSYALSYPVQYVFSQKSFANPLVRALLWHFFDQTSLDAFADYPFAGQDLDALGGARKDEVFEMLAEYQKTAVPAVEATPAATEEPAPAATEAATEAAPSATEAVTPAATEAAPAATEAVTPAATEAATEAAK